MNRLLYALTFVVGTATLGTEIAAARLLAPYFGASTVVWANTIGVVLVALALGYWLGGRLADRRPRTADLCLVVVGASLLLGIVPFVAGPFLDAATDALDAISAGAFFGSLLGVLALVALPVLLLGTVSPWVVRLAITDVSTAGQVAGRLYALSTAGSLLGTMLSALVLIPGIGTQRTFLVFALALALLGAAGLGWRFVAAPAAVAAALAIPVGTVKATATGHVLYEKETEHQYARVVEERDGTRELELNEGGAVHSVYVPGSWLTHGYWDDFLTLPFSARLRPPRRIAILGNAAGTTARAVGHFFGRTRIDAVELDPELAGIGRRYFDMHAPRLHVHADDARPWLRRSPGRYDAIFVDAYRQPYIPFYLATEEFFALARERLAPGGVIVVNVGHPEGNDDLERTLGRTMAKAFPTVLRDPAEPGNTLLLGSEAPAGRSNLLAAVGPLPDALHNNALLVAERLAPPLAGGAVWTDDWAPVEWLIDRSIVNYAATR